MVYIVCKLLGSGKTLHMNSKYGIGDYVEIVDGGHQYSSYVAAYQYFWGDIERYYIDYSFDNGKPHKIVPKYWKIINMALDPSGRTILYHIRTIDGKNSVVNEGAIKLSNFHRRNRIPIGDVKINQLPFNGNVMPHKWTDKLYKVLT